MAYGIWQAARWGRVGGSARRCALGVLSVLVHRRAQFRKRQEPRAGVLVAAGWCWVEGAWWSCHRANCHEGPARSAQWQLRSACWLVHHLGEKGVGISPGDVCSIKNLETGGP